MEGPRDQRMCRIASSDGVGWNLVSVFMGEGYYEGFRTVNEGLRTWCEALIRMRRRAEALHRTTVPTATLQ